MELPTFVLHIKRNVLLVLVYLISLSYLLFLVSSIQPDVFYTSDGGVKLMVVKQLLQGHGFKFMFLPQPSWVHEIWNMGYFPFKEPFIYPASGGYLFSFPPAFQVVSAPFYSKMGYLGLYIIPIVSATLLWISFGALLNRCAVAKSKIITALLILVFCSPLTPYGSMYWEHMPAVLLLFIGIIYLIKPLTGGSWLSFFMGLMCGLAAWLRPEALLMNLFYTCALILLYLKERNSNYLFFLAGVGLSVSAFFIFNKAAYGVPFGVHGYQVVDSDIHQFLRKGFENLITINKLSIRYFPFILVLVLSLIRSIKFKMQIELRIQLLLAIIIGYSLVTPFFMPNIGAKQWGARYFLPLIPMILIAGFLIEQKMNPAGNWRFPNWFLATALVCLVYSFLLNTVKGGIKVLRGENHHRIRPSLDFVLHQKEKVIVVGSQHIPMEMAALFNERYFFLAENDSSLSKLVPLLQKQGIHAFTYVYFVYDEHGPKALPRLLRGQPDRPKNEAFFTSRDFYISTYTIR